MEKSKDGSVSSSAAADVGAKPVKSAKSYFTTAKIAYIAMFVAINVVIGAVAPRIGSLKITLSYTVCFLSGYFFGPVAGALTGGIGDLLGCLFGGYMPNPVILLGNVLVGLIPGLVSLIKMPKLKKAEPYVHIVISYLIVFVVCTLFINTYGNYLLGLAKSNTYWVYMGIRAGTQSPIVAVNLALTFAAYPLFLRVYKMMRK